LLCRFEGTCPPTAPVQVTPSEWLLGHSAYCLKGVNPDKSNGIVSGCG